MQVPDEPVQLWSGLAMNVMPQPLRQAISLAPCLKITRPVGRLQDVVVADVDLVLAGGRLALGELDRDRGLVIRLRSRRWIGSALVAWSRW